MVVRNSISVGDSHYSNLHLTVKKVLPFRTIQEEEGPSLWLAGLMGIVDQRELGGVEQGHKDVAFVQRVGSLHLHTD